MLDIGFHLAYKLGCLHTNREDQGVLNRRQFLIKTSKWLALAALPGLTLLSCNPGRKSNEPDLKPMRPNMTLREIAKNKLHHGPEAFINPFSDVQHGRVWRAVSWKLFHKNDYKEFYRQEKITPVQVDWRPIRAHEDLSVTFLKHAALLIKDQGRYLLIDPVFGSIFPTMTDYSPLAFNPEEFPAPHHILITHGHFDHLDVESLSGFASDTHLITPLGYDDVFDDLGMSNRTKLDWFESHIDGGFCITLIPSNHWTMRNPLKGANRSLWGGFVIKTASGPTIFVVGDGGYFDGYEELGREFKPDLAIFNLGAYAPRWFMKNSHMDPEEVVKIFKQLGAKWLTIAHWGTFRLGDEPIHFPPRDLRVELARQGLSKSYIHLDHGRTVFFQQGEIFGLS